MSQRTPVVGGNWKMNMDLAGGRQLAGAVLAGCADLSDRCAVVVYPSFPHLEAVGTVLAGSGTVTLGAQNVWPGPDGAFTGEVSTAMLLDLAVSVVLAGHSERRHVLGETDDLVNAKTLAALAAGLSVTLCVGETIDQRNAGQTEKVTVNQLRRGLEGVSGADLARVVVAYEPVWAIGTGVTATPDDAQTVHQIIRATLADLYDDEFARAMRIQYGGSVKPANAAELFARDDIDGFLVGGASLKADDFLSIIRAVAQSSPH